MKTIEERADKAGLTYQFCKDKIEADHKIYAKGYIQGATEQKAIDIDKALDAHCEYCDHTCPKGMECYIRENIRKVMEE